MRNGVALGLAGLALIVATSGSAAPTPVKFSAALNIGQEVPNPKGTKAGASGRFTATLNGSTLSWKLTFKQLSGPATAAHIHAGVRGKSGPVVKPLCGPCTSGASGTVTLTAAEITALRNRKYYANVHTARNPAGEIRGQITRSLSQP